MRRCCHLPGRVLPLLVVLALPSFFPPSFPLAAAVARAIPAPAEPPPVTRAQRERIDALLITMERAGVALAERQKAVDELLGLPTGPQRLAALLSKQFPAELQGYGGQFAKAALDTLRARAKGDPTREIADLRAKVVSVSRGPNLTKERIHEIADPAMARLKTLLFISPKEVLEANAALQARRDGLPVMHGWWLAALEKTPADVRKNLKAPIDERKFLAELAAAEDAAALAATPIPAADRQALEFNAGQASGLEPGEAEGITALNRLRIAAGMNVLRIDVRLCKAGRDHSQEMKEKDYFAHESPTPALKTPWDRAGKAGTRADGECIAAGTNSGPGAIDMWWNSPGHHTIMMGAHARIGLGRYQLFWTLMTG